MNISTIYTIKNNYKNSIILETKGKKMKSLSYQNKMRDAFLGKKKRGMMKMRVNEQQGRTSIR